MEFTQNDIAVGAGRSGSRVAQIFSFGTILTVSSLVSYWIITTILAREYRLSHDNDLIGGMWAVVATIFVFRQSLRQSAKAALTRTLATFLSFALCLVYLLFFSPSILGMAVLIWLSAIILCFAGRSEEAVTAAITTAVIFVVAVLGSGPAWVQPILRLVDTAVGIVVGILASRVALLLGFPQESPEQ